MGGFCKLTSCIKNLDLLENRRQLFYHHNVSVDKYLIDKVVNGHLDT